ncbi:MAG: aminotransferase class IV family protein [Chloroflexi bacterium]|nr:aminotransferase class IV family protein [Chloroflexota bacterium]
MVIISFQITSAGDIPFHTAAKTLDGMTQELPQGFYTTFSTLSNGTKVMGFHSHLQRLYIPASEQGITPSVPEETLRARIAGLARSNLPKESRIRLILTKNDGMIYVGVQPFEPHAKYVYENGVKVVTTEMTRHDPRIKDTGFISSSVEQRKQVGRDIFEVLLVKRGRVLEGMTSNFYVVKGRTLVTAQRGILLGVTRRAILRLARGEGMSVEFRAPSVHEKFNEAFLTSSSRGVVPIVSIDNQSVGRGSVGKWTKILSKAYQAYVEERSEEIVK